MTSNDSKIRHSFTPTGMVLETIEAHFPDYVDMYMVNRRDKLLEYVFDIPAEIFKANIDNPNFDVTQYTRLLDIDLSTELEPETGIYAWMSPFTHRVFVYLE